MASAVAPLPYILFLFSTFYSQCSSFIHSHPRRSLISHTAACDSSIASSTAIRGGATNLNEIDVGTLDISKAIPQKPWSQRAYLDSCDLYDRLITCEDPHLSHLIVKALETLSHSYRLYGPTLTISSYNGGKDAVVIMNLHRAAHAHYIRSGLSDPTSSPSPPLPSPRCVYFHNPSEFPEILDLLSSTSSSLSLDLLMLKNCTFVVGLEALTLAGAKNNGRNSMAFVLGTRVGDPNCKDQKAFEPSSDWMPPFMRVNPILDWTYGSVWRFLRSFDLEYCSLYDEGYTSLGKIEETFKCPGLKRSDGGYDPAWMLKDYGMERAGRSSKVKEGKEECSVGLVVIGDEILSGLTSDTNTLSAATSLKSVGVPLDKVVIIGDDEEEIISNVRETSKIVDYIITSGGVGPTHDDITIKAIGNYYGVSCEINQEMLEFMKKKHGGTSPVDSKALEKMSTLPSNSELLYLSGPEEWPVLKIGACFVLPGVPEFFSKKVKLVSAYLQFNDVVDDVVQIDLNVEEGEILDILNKVVSDNASCKIGVYPINDVESNVKTKVTFANAERLDKKFRRGQGGRERSVSSPDDVKNAVQQLIEALPSGAVVEK
ncbi:hypothetical protein TrST_g3861 [Triparma strigata]|uniref:FAD synthase n=1 Tax=Triparma strigata TaxID=1606541 RepID=A0A9W6ZKY6_9STRA|nr:hypothetical protein TrST_g3861 [Triparma strigata]